MSSAMVTNKNRNVIKAMQNGYSRGVNRDLISCTPTSTTTFISKQKTIDEMALSNEFQNNSKDGVYLIPIAVHPTVIPQVLDENQSTPCLHQWLPIITETSKIQCRIVIPQVLNENQSLLLILTRFLHVFSKGNG